MKKEPFSSRNKWDGRKNRKQGQPAIDLSPLIDAIADEGRANRGEEKREDRGKRLREWITIGLIAATFIMLCWQVYEMVRVYGPIKDQADAARLQADAVLKQSENAERTLMQAQRAWVGPIKARIDAEPSIGKPVEIRVEYGNSGREPALDFVHSINVLAAADGVAFMQIQREIKDCQTKTDWPAGMVVYPNVGSALSERYTLSFKTKSALVTNAVVQGRSAIFFQGCFVYKTFNMPKHSYFCYFYRKGITQLDSLAICPWGHYAD